MKIGGMIKKERMKQKMSQKQLAEMAGVTTRAIAYWENGQRQISLENADKVFKALNVKVIIGMNDEKRQEMLDQLSALRFPKL